MREQPGSADVYEGFSFRYFVGAFAVFFVIIIPIVLGLGMTKGLSHDEHQHVAAGALIAREGLSPYTGFPHFHTPYLAYAYALLFRWTDHLLLAGRLLSVICASGIVAIVGTVAYQLFRHRGTRFALLVAGGTVLLAIMTRLFTETSGYAWNHEPPLFLSLLAGVAHIAGLRTTRTGWFLLSGGLLGLAIGTRITCAPLIAPFGLALLLHGSTMKWNWRRVLVHTAGLSVGLSGVLYFFAIAPEHAIFDNFGFAKANIVYRYSTGEPRTMTLATKLRFFWKLIVRPDAALFIAGLLPLAAAFLANRGRPWRLRAEIRFILLLIPFVLIGSFAPSPLFDQYFFPLVPLLLLLGLLAWTEIPRESPWYRRIVFVNAAAVLLALGMGLDAYEDFASFFKARRWHAVKLHREAAIMRSHLDQGRVLTLAPIHPLEAGLGIYPSFSTGPMAWRVSPYIEAKKAARLGIISPTTLARALEQERPAAVLVGFEKTGEEALDDFAKQHGYALFPFDKDERLWVAPVR